MISCSRLGEAWLDDVNPQRDGTDAAEITDLGQSVFGTDLKACWPAALHTVGVPLEKVRK